jgi:hypothetical protein
VSETGINVQPQKPRTSKLALLSLVLPVLGFCIVLHFGTLEWVRFFRGMWGLSAIVGFVLGVVALVKISNSSGRIAGQALATLGIGAAAISLLIMLMTPVKQPPPLLVCGSNLHRLGFAMQVYANDFDGKYPAADKWCDLLMKGRNGGYYLKEETFLCRSALKRGDKGRSHYAMNPNCEPNSPEDVVLLFETKGGWNQFGGPEILTFENHKGKGCNILFNSGQVEFVKPEQISKLRWKAE